MTADHRQKRTSGVTLGCLVALGLAILLLLGVGGFLLFQAWLSRPLSTAWITSPQTDQQVPINEPVDVLAGASDHAGPSRVEVYADGALILAQDSAGQHETELNLTGSWTPVSAGRHVLMARGYTANDESADSQLVYVDVLEASQTAPAAGPAPSPTAPATLPGSTTGTTHGASAPPSPRAGSPAAPTGLFVGATCTSALLTWNSSPAAQTYRVYRLGAATATRIADRLTATTFTDRLLAPGTYRYQVAAVRGRLETRTPVFIARSPADCLGSSPPPGTAGDLVLTLAMVDTDEEWSGLYCFLAVNGGATERYPAGDWTFLNPVTSNAKYYNLTRLPEGGRIFLTGQPVSEPITLKGECVGRTSSTVPDPNPGLGVFRVSHPQTDWDGTLRSTPGGRYRFSYCLGPSTIPCTPPIPGGAAATRSSDLPSEWFLFPVPTNVRRTLSSAACDSISDPALEFACRDAALVCELTGCAGPHTITWDWTATPFFPESSLTGYTVYRTTHGRGPLMTYGWDVNRIAGGTLPRRFLEDSEPACGQTVEYRVAANQADRHSALSNPWSFDTRSCGP